MTRKYGSPEATNTHYTTDCFHFPTKNQEKPCSIFLLLMKLELKTTKNFSHCTEISSVPRQISWALNPHNQKWFQTWQNMLVYNINHRFCWQEWPYLHILGHTAVQKWWGWGGSGVLLIFFFCPDCEESLVTCIRKSVMVCYSVKRQRARN